MIIIDIRSKKCFEDQEYYMNILRQSERAEIERELKRPIKTFINEFLFLLFFFVGFYLIYVFIWGIGS